MGTHLNGRASRWGEPLRNVPNLKGDTSQKICLQFLMDRRGDCDIIFSNII